MELGQSLYTQVHEEASAQRIKVDRSLGGKEMFQLNDYLILRIMEMHVEEAIHEAGIRRLLRGAGIDRQGWLSKQGRLLLCRMGHLLVRWGQQLQRYGLPQTTPFKEQRAGGVFSGNGG